MTDHLIPLTLTQGQISTLLWVIEGYVQGNDDYSSDPELAQDIDSICEVLENA